jgi:hypothetical protein
MTIIMGLDLSNTFGFKITFLPWNDGITHALDF